MLIHGKPHKQKNCETTETDSISNWTHNIPFP